MHHIAFHRVIRRGHLAGKNEPVWVQFGFLTEGPACDRAVRRWGISWHPDGSETPIVSTLSFPTLFWNWLINVNWLVQMSVYDLCQMLAKKWGTVSDLGDCVNWILRGFFLRPKKHTGVRGKQNWSCILCILFWIFGFLTCNRNFGNVSFFFI